MHRMVYFERCCIRSTIPFKINHLQCLTYFIIYVKNEFLTAGSSCTSRYFWEDFCRSLLLLVPFPSELVDFPNHSASLKILNIAKKAICRFPSILQRLTAPEIIDKFTRNRYQKKRKDICYKLLQDFIKKELVVQELQAVRASVQTIKPLKTNDNNSVRLGNFCDKLSNFKKNKT